MGNLEQKIDCNFALYEEIFSFCRQSKMQRNFFWTPPLDKFRFKLGAALVDTRIPYYIDRDITIAFEKGLSELVTLFVMANKENIPANEYDAFLLTLDNIHISVGEPKYDISELKPGSMVQKIIARSLGHDPAANVDITSRWFGENGNGRAIFSLISTLLQKALKEGMSTSTGEDSFRFTLLVFIRLARGIINSALTKIRSEAIAARISYSVSSVCSALFQIIVEEILIAASLDNVSASQAPHVFAARTLCFPHNFSGSPFPTEYTLQYSYGISRPVFDAYNAVFGNVLERNVPISKMREMIKEKSPLDKDALQKWLESWQKISMRDGIVEALLKTPASKLPQASGVSSQLIPMLISDESLNNFIRNPKLVKSFGDMVKNLSKGDPNAVAALSGLIEIGEKMKNITEFSIGMFGGKGKSKLSDDAADRFLAARLDMLASESAAGALNLLEDRSSDEREKGDANLENYNAGRLYRFSRREEPLLLYSEATTHGHLFMDLKDFTKRTFMAKEIVMADFMMNEFYEPVLATAKNYHTGMVALTDRGQVILNNLIGDAISISGGITAIVRLSRDIMGVLSSYQDKLKEKVPPAEIKKRQEELFEKFSESKDKLTRQIDKYNAQLRQLAATPDVNPAQTERVNYELGLIDSMLGELEQDYENQRVMLAGMGIDSGIFVSYGRSAQYQSYRDDVWGTWQIAIAEKINESARGTDRNGAVRRRLNARLADERKRRLNQALIYPNKVFIEKVYQMSLPTNMEMELEKTLHTPDGTAARNCFSQMANHYLNDYTRNILSGGDKLDSISSDNGIYNNGCALSREALDAYTEVVSTQMNILQKQVAVTELHEEIQNTFLFAVDPLQLIFIHHHDGQGQVEIFMYVGEIIFKGFEKANPLPVWEMIDPQSKFYLMLMEKHFHNWRMGA